MQKHEIHQFKDNFFQHPNNTIRQEPVLWCLYWGDSSNAGRGDGIGGGDEGSGSAGGHDCGNALDTCSEFFSIKFLHLFSFNTWFLALK